MCSAKRAKQDVCEHLGMLVNIPADVVAAKHHRSNASGVASGKAVDKTDLGLCVVQLVVPTTKQHNHYTHHAVVYTAESFQHRQDHVQLHLLATE